jgi:hypothetical protein
MSPDSRPSGPAPESATSLTLLQRARDRDQDAWARVARLYAPLV